MLPPTPCATGPSPTTEAHPPNDDLRVARVVDALVGAVPEFLPSVDELHCRHDDHLSVGAVLSEFAAFTAASTGTVPVPTSLTQRAMDVVEMLLEDADIDDRDEIGYSFLGNLPLLTIAAGIPSMGPTTLNVLESLDDVWG